MLEEKHALRAVTPLPASRLAPPHSPYLCGALVFETLLRHKDSQDGPASPCPPQRSVFEGRGKGSILRALRIMGHPAYTSVQILPSPDHRSCIPFATISFRSRRPGTPRPAQLPPEAGSPRRRALPPAQVFCIPRLPEIGCPVYVLRFTFWNFAGPSQFAFTRLVSFREKPPRRG